MIFESSTYEPAPGVPIHEWCFIHLRREPFLSGDYRACGECYHVFRTAEELIIETAERYAEMATDAGIGRVVPPTDAASIYVCPLCTHDF